MEVDGELEAMRTMARLVGSMSPEARVRVARWLASYVAETAPASAATSNGRGVSDKWRPALVRLGEGAATNEAILAAVAAAGHDVTAAQVRGQMHHYCKLGWAIRGDAGYDLTAAGREVLVN